MRLEEKGDSEPVLRLGAESSAHGGRERGEDWSLRNDYAKDDQMKDSRIHLLEVHMAHGTRHSRAAGEDEPKGMANTESFAYAYHGWGNHRLPCNWI
jgi:hypothetical protein